VKLFKGQDELDLTSGGIGRPLFYLSLPIVVTNLLQTAYNLADTFWLGQYSTEALAAISFAFPMVFLLISLGIGLSVAGSVLVAQNVGAGDVRQAEFAASQTVTFALVVSVVLGAVGYVIVGPLLALLGASPDVLPGATAYMHVIAVGLPFMFGFFIFFSLMRGAGDTVTPMLLMLVTVVINVVLDPLFIFGWTIPALSAGGQTLVPALDFPEMGVQGAAVATILSRMLAMTAGLAIMFSGRRGVEIHLQDMVPDPAYFRKMVSIGVPASIEGSSRALSVNALLAVVGLFATPVVAAFGIGTRVFSVIFLPALAVSQGVETMTGQNIGAGKYDRAEQTNYLAAKVLFVVLGAVGVLIFLVPRPIVSVFTDDPPVIEAGVTFLRIVALTFGFTGIMRAFTGGFRGSGHTKIAAGVAIAMLWVIRLPAAAAGALTVGQEGVWFSFALSNVAGAVIAYLWFRRGTWREGDVRGGSAGPGPAASDEAGDAATTDD